MQFKTLKIKLDSLQVYIDSWCKIGIYVNYKLERKNRKSVLLGMERVLARFSRKPTPSLYLRQSLNEHAILKLGL